MSHTHRAGEEEQEALKEWPFMRNIKTCTYTGQAYYEVGSYFGYIIEGIDTHIIR